jgi:hypothetical protein
MSNTILSKPIVLLTIFLISSELKARTIEKEMLVMYVEEKVNDLVFKHKMQRENGMTKEVYTINDIGTTGQEYEEALLNAEKEERRQERRLAHEARVKFYDTHYKVRVKLIKTELRPQIQILESELKRLSDERLKPYRVFVQSFLVGSYEELLTFGRELVDHVTTMLNQPDDITDIKKLQDIARDTTRVIQQMHDTFFATVNNGIDKGDDTRLLKELLMLVS